MGLLSTNISKSKKLSPDAFKIKPKERVLSVSGTEDKKVEKPLGAEDIAYSKLVKQNPLLDSLIDTFGLVNADTGEPLRKAKEGETIPITTPEREVKIEVEVVYQKPQEKPVERLKTANGDAKLFSLAAKVVREGDSMTREEIISQLQRETEVSQERAETGFNMMLEVGAITRVHERNSYYLTSSTPF